MAKIDLFLLKKIGKQFIEVNVLLFSFLSDSHWVTDLMNDLKLLVVVKTTIENILFRVDLRFYPYFE